MLPVHTHPRCFAGLDVYDSYLVLTIDCDTTWAKRLSFTSADDPIAVRSADLQHPRRKVVHPVELLDVEVGSSVHDGFFSAPCKLPNDSGKLTV